MYYSVVRLFCGRRLCILFMLSYFRNRESLNPSQIWQRTFLITESVPSYKLKIIWLNFFNLSHWNVGEKSSSFNIDDTFI